MNTDWLTIRFSGRGKSNVKKKLPHPKPKEEYMLVLSRKSTESIHIGDSVVVTVLEIRGNRTRIGIAAPDDVHVLRSELLDRVSNASGNGSHATVAPAGSSDPRGIEALETDGPSG